MPTIKEREEQYIENIEYFENIEYLFEKYEVDDRSDAASYLLDLLYDGKDPFNNLDFYIQQYKSQKKFKKDFNKLLDEK